jgi:hypothetical protein
MGIRGMVKGLGLEGCWWLVARELRLPLVILV